MRSSTPGRRGRVRGNPERRWPWVLATVWKLRHNIGQSDAPYLAIAQAYDVPLLTFDERLARAAREVGVNVMVPS